MVEMLRTYDMPRPAPVIQIEKLYFRNNPIYHDILSGYNEARLLMGMPIEAKLNSIMKKKFPADKTGDPDKRWSQLASCCSSNLKN